MKRALLVGIDHYPTVGSLTGCVADATALADLMRSHADGSPNFSVELLAGTDRSPAVTRDVLRDSLTRLFANPRDTDLLFFFAGHGGQTLWGADLVTQDATANSLGVSMNDLIMLANSSAARSVTVIIDCCYSGDAGNLPGMQAAAVAEPFRLATAVLRENVTVMSASRATEASEEFDGHGAFTRVLLDGLDGGATDHIGNVTSLSLYGYVSAAFDSWQQRPLFKANLTEPRVLRVGPPWLEASLLRQLPDHFPTADARVRMSPAHEGEGRPLPDGDSGTPEQQQFDYFARLRNANLATTDDGRAHYWVAMESGEVYLTQLGRYFWGLAKRGVL
jgi:hypothetical protein